MQHSRLFKKLFSAVKGATALGVISCLTALPLLASSHAEAPLISMDRYADNTDVYAFRSMETGRSNFVTLIANYIPFEDPSGGPQFYRFDDSVLYEINIDNTGDGLPDISYQFRFTTPTPKNVQTVLGHTAFNQGGVVSSINDPDYNMPQFYTVTRHNHITGADTILANNVPTPPANVGPIVTPNYESTLGINGVHTINAAGMRIFAGQRDEGFLVDVGGIFDGLNVKPLTNKTNGISATDGFNVNSIAIEVPISDLTRDGAVPTSSSANNAVVGVYATASRQTTTVRSPGGITRSGSFVQVSRIGNPLVNEAVIPLALKDTFNAIRPNVDGTVPAVVTAITDPDLTKLLVQKFGITAPPAPRNDMVAIFGTGIPLNAIPALTNTGYTTFLSDGVAHEMLRLNVAIGPTSYTSLNRLGLLGGDFAGYPNGRRVEDNVTDISLRVLAGGTPFTPVTNVAPNNTLTEGVNGNDYNINPITGADLGGTIYGAYSNPFTGASTFPANGTAYDYLQRFPYLAPPHPGDTPRMPTNQR